MENMMVLNVVLAGDFVAYADRRPDKVFTLQGNKARKKQYARICGRSGTRRRGKIIFFVAQRNNQHINVNGVDQLSAEDISLLQKSWW